MSGPTRNSRRRIPPYLLLLLMIPLGSFTASEEFFLLGDRDGFGLGMMEGDVRPGSLGFFEGREPDDPSFTDVLPTSREFCYVHDFPFRNRDSILSADLSFFTLGIQDGDSQVFGSDTDIRLFLDGEEVPGAFDDVDQFFFDQGGSEFVSSAGLVTIPIPDLLLDLLVDGALEIQIQVLQLGTAPSRDAFAIDYSELHIVSTQDGGGELSGRIVGICSPFQPGEDANGNCVLDSGEDRGCDGVVGRCPMESPGEFTGDGFGVELEPNDCIGGGSPECDVTPPDFGSQRVSLPLQVGGNVSVGDPGWNAFDDVWEDNYVFDVTSPTTFSARLGLGCRGPNGVPPDLDFLLWSLSPFGVLDSGVGSFLPETMGPISLDPGTYFVSVSAWDDLEDQDVQYLLEAVSGEEDVGCDGIPATGDLGEGNVRVDIPSDSGEGNGVLDVPSDSDCILQVDAVCDVQPITLNLKSRGDSLSIKSTLFDSISGEVLDPDLMSPVHISRISSPGTGDTILGTPNAEPGCDDLSEDGIWESPGERTIDDFGRVHLNFSSSSDGHCETMDGNRQDIIALLLDVPNGENATICYTATYGDQLSPVECCAPVTVINHGNR